MSKSSVIFLPPRRRFAGAERGSRFSQGTIRILYDRVRATGSQDGRDREARFANIRDAIQPNPRRAHILAGRNVLLVDDVMTSGASLSAAAEALVTHGAAEVSILVLARAGRAT